MTCPFPNFNVCTAEVWEWISNFIPRFIVGGSTYACWEFKYAILVKGVPVYQVADVSSSGTESTPSVLLHYNNVTWTSCSLKSPVIRMFVLQIVPTNTKETSNKHCQPSVRGIHLWKVNSPHKRPVTRKIACNDVIVSLYTAHFIKNVHGSSPCPVWCGWVLGPVSI